MLSTIGTRTDATARAGSSMNKHVMASTRPGTPHT